MSILFLLLKIVLFIIIALISLLLFLILLILFVPIKYKIEVDSSEAYVDVSWLFRIFVFNYNYFIDKNKSDSNLKIFGISLKKNDSEFEKKAEPVKEDKPRYQFFKKNKDSKTKLNKGKKKETDEDCIEETDFFEKAKEFYFMIKGILDYEDRKEITEATLTLFKKIIRGIYPKYHKISGTYGFDKANITGYFTAIISIIIAFIGLNTELVPTFDKKIFDIKIFLKGKIYMYILIFSILKYIFYKPIWKLVKKYFLKIN